MKWYLYKVGFRVWSKDQQNIERFKAREDVFTIAQSEREAADRIRTIREIPMEIVEIERQVELSGMWGTAVYVPIQEKTA